MSANTSFKDPGLLNEAEGNVQDKTSQGMSDLSNIRGGSTDLSKGINKFVQDVDPESLNVVQRANQAKGQGQFGAINNKDYSTTLRLARAADAYNARPREHTVAVGTFDTGGVKDLGLAYERPELNTVEQRVVNQAMQLDTNQKTLAQQLQAAVAAKDYDSFKMLMNQMYGLNLTDAQAKIQLTQFARQQEIQQYLTKDWSRFQAFFTRYVSEDTARTLFEIAERDQQLAAAIGYSINGTVPPATQDRLLDAAIRTRAKELKDSYKYDDISAYNEAKLEITRDMYSLFNKQEYVTAKSQRIDQKLKDRLEANRNLKNRSKA